MLIENREKADPEASGTLTDDPETNIDKAQAVKHTEEAATAKNATANVKAAEDQAANVKAAEDQAANAKAAEVSCVLWFVCRVYADSG